METAKISLSQSDIVIPFRGAQADRLENLYTLLAFFRQTYCDYKVILVEADTEPRFSWVRLKDPAVCHYFFYSDRPFPKGRAINEGVRLSRSDRVILHDADSIANPHIMKECLDDLISENPHADVWCPYRELINISGSLKDAFAAQPDYVRVADISLNHLPEGASKLYDSTPASVVILRRRDFIRFGGYNEAMEGWGGEDNEILFRFSRLGCRWICRISPLIHLHHDSAPRDKMIESTKESPNVLMAQQTQEMPLPQLEALAQDLSLRNFS